MVKTIHKRFMRIRLLLLCACVGTHAETLDNLSMEKALIAAYHISFDAMVPRVHAMSLEGTLLQQSSNDKAVHTHYITLKKNLHEFEHDSEQRRSLRDEDHRFLSKKAKYLEACIRAKCTKGQQCSDVGTCQACKIGTFAAADFVLQCAKCPAGTHGTEAVDKDAQEACKPCPVGFYTDKEGQAECTPCSPGTFQNTTGATGCVDAGVPVHTVLCNDTHFFPEGATDVDTATTPVFRNGEECPSSKTRKNDFPKWAIALLCVLGGMLIGACILCFVC